MKYVDLPFELGSTLSGTDDNSNLINESWLGQIFEVPSQQLGVSQIRGGKKRNVGRQIKVVALRNVSGVTLYGKRLAQLYDSAGYSLLKEVDGYTITTGTKNCVIIDEFLSSTGVADDDIFWGVLEGPVTVKMQTLAAASSVVVVGDKVVAGTGSGTSGNSTAGGVGLSATPAVAVIVGTALSGRTTADTGDDCLISACISAV